MTEWDGFGDFLKDMPKEKPKTKRAACPTCANLYQESEPEGCKDLWHNAAVMHVSVSSSRVYKIGGFGVAALKMLLDPDYRVSIRDLGPGDRVTLTVMLEDVTAVRVDLPAGFFEEVKR